MAHWIGMIGLGVMGSRMLAQFADCPGLAVVAAWDPSANAAEQARAAYPGLNLVASAAAVVREPAVDCVYVASPPSTHLDYAHLAFDRGKPVLCEKPLSLDASASLGAVERVEREGLSAAVNFPYASSPTLKAVEAALEAGALGPLEGLEIVLAYDQWPERWQVAARWLGLRAEGGFVREVVTHMAFLTRRLLGPLAVEAARIDYPGDGVGAETEIEARLSAGGLPVTIHGRVDPAAAEAMHWTLTGRDGALRVHDWYSLSRRGGDGDWRDVDLGPGSPRTRAYRAQLDSLTEMLAGRPHPIATFREGLEVQLCIEELIRRGGA